jgi:hypothetical protein
MGKLINGGICPACTRLQIEQAPGGKTSALICA